MKNAKETQHHIYMRKIDNKQTPLKVKIMLTESKCLEITI